MNESGEKNYKRDFVHLMLSSGLTDESFIEGYFEDREVERSLRAVDPRDLSGYEAELAHLTGDAEALYRLYERTWLGGQSRAQVGDIRPKKHHRRRRAKNIAGAWERQEALARYLARFAGEIPDVRRFRRHYLGGGVLDAAAAKELLTSPHAASRHHFFARQDGRNSLLKPLDVETGEDEEGPYKRIVVQGAGRPRRFLLRPLMLSRTHGLVFPGDVLGSRDIETRYSFFPPAPTPDLIVFPHPGKAGRYVVVKENSVLDELTKISERRLRSYPIDPDKGSWFILTGEFIASDPAHISFAKHTHATFTRSTITIEVESWTSPEEVADYYRHAQDEVLGRRPRSLKRNSLTVFEFVNERPGKSWQELFEAWNGTHATLERFKDRSHLYTAYDRASEKIAAVKRAKTIKRPKMVSNKGFGAQVFAGKWYILHGQPYRGHTGYFDSKEDALADPRSEGSEVVTSEELVARRKKELADRIPEEH